MRFTLDFIGRNRLSGGRENGLGEKIFRQIPRFRGFRGDAGKGISPFGNRSGVVPARSRADFRAVGRSVRFRTALPPPTARRIERNNK